MNYKDNSNFGWKAGFGARNTEDALLGLKYREFNQFREFYQNFSLDHVFSRILGNFACFAIMIVKN